MSQVTMFRPITTMFSTARVSAVLSIIVCTMLLVSGCRTYGARGSVEATYEQLQASFNEFQAELERAKLGLKVMSQAAEENVILASLVDEYETVVEEHALVLADQRARLNDLRGSDDYRELSRSLGAFVTEHRVMRNRYQALFGAARAALGDTTLTRDPARPEGRYVPPVSRYYMFPYPYDQMGNLHRGTNELYSLETAPPDTAASDTAGGSN